MLALLLLLLNTNSTSELLSFLSAEEIFSLLFLSKLSNYLLLSSPNRFEKVVRVHSLFREEWKKYFPLYPPQSSSLYVRWKSWMFSSVCPTNWFHVYRYLVHYQVDLTLLSYCGKSIPRPLSLSYMHPFQRKSLPVTSRNTFIATAHFLQNPEWQAYYLRVAKVELDFLRHSRSAGIGKEIFLDTINQINLLLFPLFFSLLIFGFLLLRVSYELHPSLIHNLIPFIVFFPSPYAMMHLLNFDIVDFWENTDALYLGPLYIFGALFPGLAICLESWRDFVFFTFLGFLLFKPGCYYFLYWMKPHQENVPIAVPLAAFLLFPWFFGLVTTQGYFGSALVAWLTLMIGKPIADLIQRYGYICNYLRFMVLASFLLVPLAWTISRPNPPFCALSAMVLLALYVPCLQRTIQRK